MMAREGGASFRGREENRSAAITFFWKRSTDPESEQTSSPPPSLSSHKSAGPQQVRRPQVGEVMVQKARSRHLL